MKGNPEIITELNRLLTGEMTAVDQYFLHARMYEDWGLNTLFERINHEVQDELGHASALVERILFLEGTPAIGAREALNIGTDVPGMLRNDLELEYKVVKDLREVMALCESHGDYVSRDILLKMLDDTENDHAHWLEIQLGLIERLGLANYQQSMR